MLMTPEFLKKRGVDRTSTSVAFYRQHQDFRTAETAPCDKLRAGALKQQAGISGDGAGSWWRIGCGKNKCRCGRLPNGMVWSEDKDSRFKNKF
jgi:hypothetical protein